MMEGRGALKTVLCFGDSNTFGYDPIGVAAGERARYPFEERWPGAMQRLLGSGWRVVEEGLSGRTTVHDDPFEPGLCGMDALGVRPGERPAAGLRHHHAGHQRHEDVLRLARE